MVHEQVVGAPNATLLLASQEPSLSFERVGLCCAEVRAERLGCSHTMSRSNLETAIGELGRPTAEHLRYELNWITNEIHLLDHRKGAAEARLARARQEKRGQGRDEGEFKLLEEYREVKRLELQHDEYVERIGALRDRVVLELEGTIRELQQLEFGDKRRRLGVARCERRYSSRSS
jgi:hypothetical protein